MLARDRLGAAAVVIGVVGAVTSLHAPVGAATTTVDVVNNAYDPTPVGIVAGDAVTWTFSGSAPHSVTAEPGQPITFDSHPACGNGGTCGTPGQTFTTSFAEPGTYRYYCRIHGAPGGVGMAGVVTVRSTATDPSAGPSASPSSSPSTAPSPSASPDSSPAGAAPTLVAPSVATAGVVVTVRGTASPGALVEIFGVTAPNASLLKVTETTADSAGSWVRTIRPLRNVNLQARSGGRSSPTRFVAVRTAVRHSVAALAGCVVQVSGAVFEPKPGAVVFLRAVDAAGRTVSLGSGVVQGDGRFLLRRAYACGAALRVYAVIEGDSVNRPGATGTQAVTTRR